MWIWLTSLVTLNPILCQWQQGKSWNSSLGSAWVRSFACPSLQQMARYCCIHLDLFAVGEFLCLSGYCLLMIGAQWVLPKVAPNSKKS